MLEGGGVCHKIKNGEGAGLEDDQVHHFWVVSAAGKVKRVKGRTSSPTGHGAMYKKSSQQALVYRRLAPRTSRKVGAAVGDEMLLLMVGLRERGETGFVGLAVRPHWA